jgi:hypothetical protein
VASDEDDFVNSKVEQKQQQRKALQGSSSVAAHPAAAGPNAAGAAGTAAAAAAAAAAHGSLQPTEQDMEAALQWLRKEITKAGGSLGEGWKVLLSGRRADGKWRNRRFVAPDGTVCYTAPQVKRHLGLEAPAGEQT